MFPSLQYDHPAWYSVISIVWYLFIFMGIVIGVVFLLRKPMRKHKKYDLAVFRHIQPWHTPANNRIMKGITLLGKHQFLVPANLLLIGGFFFFSDHHWYAFDILVLSLSSLLMMFLLKRLFRRNRPEIPLLFAARGKSFPSGHAMMSVCFFGFLLHLLLQLTTGHALHIILSIFFITLILLIGFSRVYLQVHYLSDVLAGFIIGSAWLFVALQVFKKLEDINVV